jgi:hypothetical protein
MKTLNQLRVIALCSLFIVSQNGCSNLPIHDTIDSSVQQIDEAINKITNQSESWQATLQDLTGKVNETIKGDIQNLMDRTIASAQESVMCTHDFLVKRLIQNLNRIKARLLNQPLPPLEPFICKASPSTISSYSPPGEVILSGYDFDSAKNNLKGFLVQTGEGKFAIPASAIEVQTNYRAIINLSRLNILTIHDKLSVYFKNTELIPVPVTHRKCETMAGGVDEQNMTFNPSKESGGDKDFGWNWARFKIKVSRLYLSNNKMKVLADIEIGVVETNDKGVPEQGGWKTRAYYKEDGIVLYNNANSNFEITSITSVKTKFEKTEYNKIEDSEMFTYGENSVVKSAKVWGRQYGGDDIDHCKTILVFNEVKVELKEKNKCIN